MTRDEHLTWCKQRACEYLDRGDVKNAIASMMSDVTKHPDTAHLSQSLAGLGLLIAMDNDTVAARRFIEGFR